MAKAIDMTPIYTRHNGHYIINDDYLELLREYNATYGDLLGNQKYLEPLPLPGRDND